MLNWLRFILSDWHLFHEMNWIIKLIASSSSAMESLQDELDQNSVQVSVFCCFLKVVNYQWTKFSFVIKFNIQWSCSGCRRGFIYYRRWTWQLESFLKNENDNARYYSNKDKTWTPGDFRMFVNSLWHIK